MPLNLQPATLIGPSDPTNPQSALLGIRFDFNPENVNAQLGNPGMQMSQTQSTDGSSTTTYTGVLSPQTGARTPKFQFKGYMRRDGAGSTTPGQLMSDALTMQMWCTPAPTGHRTGTGSGAGAGAAAPTGEHHDAPPGDKPKATSNDQAPPSTDVIPVKFKWGSAFDVDGTMIACTVVFLSF